MKSCGKRSKDVYKRQGLVGLDAAYGLIERGKKVTVVEMAEQILPVQLDAHARCV